jgi:PPOX class probable F420-dependent enzyme
MRLHVWEPVIMGNLEQDQQVWEQLRKNKAEYISLGTRKHDGAVVRTPVWFVVDGSDLIITTESTSGKAKRIRNYPEIDLAECNMRGRIGGELITAAAQVMPTSVYADCEKLFIKKFKLMYKLMTMRGKKNDRNNPDNPDGGRIFISISRTGFAPNE